MPVAAYARLARRDTAEGSSKLGPAVDEHVQDVSHLGAFKFLMSAVF